MIEATVLVLVKALHRGPPFPSSLAQGPETPVRFQPESLRPASD